MINTTKEKTSTWQCYLKSIVFKKYVTFISIKVYDLEHLDVETRKRLISLIFEYVPSKKLS